MTIEKNLLGENIEGVNRPWFYAENRRTQHRMEMREASNECLQVAHIGFLVGKNRSIREGTNAKKLTTSFKFDEGNGYEDPYYSAGGFDQADRVAFELYYGAGKDIFPGYLVDIIAPPFIGRVSTDELYVVVTKELGTQRVLHASIYDGKPNIVDNPAKQVIQLSRLLSSESPGAIANRILGKVAKETSELALDTLQETSYIKGAVIEEEK